MFDPDVHVSMTAQMRAIQRLVSAGYPFYVTGRVEARNALLLAAKFDERFHVSARDKQREYAAKKRLFSTKLVFHPISGSTDLHFWLLRTEGDHPLLKSEKWRDARTDPITWPFLYELRQVPVPPEHRKRFERQGGKIAIRPVTWTWRIQRAEMDRLRACIRHWVQFPDERLRRLIRGLSLSPGFRAVRDDVYTLQRYIAQQCQKRDKPVPEFPLRRGLLLAKGRSYKTYPLSLLVARVRSGSETWFPENHKSRDTADSHKILMEKPDAQAVRPENDPG